MSSLEENMFTFDVFFIDAKYGWFLTTEELSGTGDGGQTWAVKLKVDYATYGIVRDFYFTNSKTGWLVTSNGTVLKCSS